MLELWAERTEITRGLLAQPTEIVAGLRIDPTAIITGLRTECAKTLAEFRRRPTWGRRVRGGLRDRTSGPVDPEW
jgi:hypothetical protein